MAEALYILTSWTQAVGHGDMAGPEMLVITKVYDLVIWSCRHVTKFPRSHRFTLGDRLEVRLYQVLEMLIRAKYTRDRASLLRAVNVELELLRFQFRIAKDLQCLSVDSYGYAARSVDEVGRLLGGWVKQSEAPRRPVGAPDELSEPGPNLQGRGAGKPGQA